MPEHAKGRKFKLPLGTGAMVLVLLLPCFAQQSFQQIDLTSVGYKALSSMARRSDKANLTIDFIDSDQVLVTFNPKGMFKRLPDCPPTHDDRLMEAVVIKIASGQTLHRSTWYLHDGRPFLWPLGAHKFLLRRLNSLYLLDSALQEKLSFTSPSALLWVSVTPDGKQVLDEVLDDSARSKAGESGPKVRLEFRDAQTFSLDRVIILDKEVPLEATSSGYASVIAGFSGRVWLVRFGPTQQRRDNVTRVRTRRVPDVLYLNSNALLVGRDSAGIPGYSVSAFSVSGKLLWRQHWDEHRYSPMVERSEDGSRFAISTVWPMDAPGTVKDPVDESSEGLIQKIQVFNTASGELVYGTEATPVFTSGRNFTLSPDGGQLVVLKGTALQFYDLRPMSSDERAKYTALKADLPGLFVPPAADPNPDGGSASGASDRPPEPGQPDASTSVPSSPAADNPGAPAQTPPADPIAIPTFKSRREIVALDVVVTDLSGHPVKSLPRDIFQIKEDGKLQTISNFQEVSVDASNPAKPAPHNPAKDKPPNVFSTESSGEVQGGVTVILFDLLNTPAPDQQSAKAALIDLIQHKPKNARFALCALTEGLSMLQGFTPDEGLLAHALKRNKGSLRFTSVEGEDANDQMLLNWLGAGGQKTVAQLGPARGGPGAVMLQDMAGKLEQDLTQRHAQDLELRMAITMDAFTQLARYLAALPGRKSILWLSGSFPLGIFPGMDFRNPNAESANSSGQIKQTVNLLAESHIAVYPVDVRGLAAAGLEDPFASPPQPAQPSQTSQTTRFNQLSNLNAPGAIGSTGEGTDSPFAQQAIEHGLMTQIAEDTGGQAYYNTNGLLQAMTGAMEQAANYYELSYTPTNGKYDGKFRRIKLSVVGEKRIRVMHRSGYFAVDPDSPVSRDAGRGFGLAAMQADAPQARQLAFEVRVVPLGKPVLSQIPSRSAPLKKRKAPGEKSQPPEPAEVERYAIDYAVSASQLHFDATPDGLEHAALNFMVASFAADGSVQTSIGSHASGNLSHTTYQDVLAGGFRMHQEVDVPVRSASLRVGVQDTITGRMGTLEVPLPVKALPGVQASHARRLPDIEPD